jgi:hypothetical protein
MSAFGGKADIETSGRDVSFWPIADIEPQPTPANCAVRQNALAAGHKIDLTTYIFESTRRSHMLTSHARQERPKDPEDDDNEDEEDDEDEGEEEPAVVREPID